MATLEVHDGHGGVEYVNIAPQSASLIGTDPKCDVVLNGAGVLPIHARLRWKRGRLKVDVTPGAPPLVVNDKRMLSTKLQQGDEIQIGACRIFVLSIDGEPVEDEKTVVQTPPRAAAAPAAPTRSPVSRAAGPPADPDLLAGLDVAPPSVESVVDELPAVPAPWRGGRSERPSKKTKRPAPGPARPGRWHRWREALSGADRPPGDERLLSSPIVLGLVGTIAVLALLSFALWRTIARRGPKASSNWPWTASTMAITSTPRGGSSSFWSSIRAMLV